MMKLIAAPMIGGLFMSFLLELPVYSALCATCNWNTGFKKGKTLFAADAS